MLAERMNELVFGQEEACRLVEEQIDIYQSGLLPEDRPAGIFMLYGPTGAGKTHTVEAAAHALHNDHRKYLRIDCGELQLDHEIAKLIGSPPGYLGHRETSPWLTQHKVNHVTSEQNNLSLLCFDEIEKGSKALHRLLLGVFDKARLRLGDNTEVRFDKTFIFMTSNIGTAAGTSLAGLNLDLKDKDDARTLFKEKFDPEFLNRVDQFIGYQPLSQEHLAKILGRHMDALQARIVNAMSQDAFTIELSPAARAYILKEADVPKWGARELARIIQRKVTVPLARLILSRRFLDPVSQTETDLEAGCKVLIDYKDSQIVLICQRASLEDLLRASVITSEWRKRNKQ